jgi:hypothetical protein
VNVDRFGRVGDVVQWGEKVAGKILDVDSNLTRRGRVVTVIAATVSAPGGVWIHMTNDLDESIPVRHGVMVYRGDGDYMVVKQPPAATPAPPHLSLAEALKRLRFIDRDQLPLAMSDREWTDFRDDPAGFLIKATDEFAAAVDAIVQAPVREPPTVWRLAMSYSTDTGHTVSLDRFVGTRRTAKVTVESFMPPGESETDARDVAARLQAVLNGGVRRD